MAVSVVAALVGWGIQNYRERQASIDKTLFDVYMLFLELLGTYFWVASAEVRKEESPQEMRAKSQELAWRIADKLRQEDRIPFMSDLLTILFGEAAYSSAAARHDAMNELADRLGERVNPRYKEAVGALTPRNLEAISSKGLKERNAPGHMWM